jgi:hypothetical protein
MVSHITGTICTEFYGILKFLQLWPDDGHFRQQNVVISEFKNLVVFDGNVTICWKQNSFVFSVDPSKFRLFSSEVPLNF